MKAFYFPLAVVAVLLMLFTGCDLTDVNSSGDLTADNVINFELETGSSLQITLDPTAVQQQQNFKNGEELEAYYEEIIAKGSLTLNENLYKQLSHALAPWEIAVLDQKGQVRVGEFLYEASPEAVLRRPFENLTSEPEIDVYYGLNGDADIKELKLVIDHTGRLEELQDYVFKDPNIYAIYQRRLENQLTEAKQTVAKISSFDDQFLQTGTTTFNFSHPNNPPGGGSYSHDRGYQVWNESTGGLFSRKALAGTERVYRPTGTSTWYNWNYGSYYCQGSYPWVKAEAYGGNGTDIDEGTCSCRAETSRKSGHGAESWHWGGSRNPLPPPGGGYLYIYELGSQGAGHHLG